MRLLLLLLAGCELIADIPDPRVVESDGGGSGSDAQMLECTSNAACSGTEPICATETTHECRACIADDECPAGVCMADGSCADAARFVYAAAAGTGTDCSSALPCSLDQAVLSLTPAKDIVKMAPGTYVRATGITMTLPGTIAGSGSTINLSTATQATTAFNSMGVAMTLVGLTVTMNMMVQGVRCSTGGALTLSRVTLANGSTGVFSGMCPVVVDRSRITGVNFYGLYSNSAPVTVRNSYLTNNGNPTYTIAAIHLNAVPSATIEHVTIANNLGMTEGGIQCVGSPTVTIRNIVSWNNAPPGIGADCVVTSSIVEASYVGGSGNASMDPLFVNAAGGDYKLMPTSPAVGRGDPAAAVTMDADGESRPQPAGSNPDPGADEIP